jgi:2-polyprenyl-3-methyl-5-hydroxy-6-metoxy-1,4-benzoquinol methylase
MSVEHRNYGWSEAGANESHLYLLPPLLAFARRLLSGRRARILDLGCGNGYLTHQLSLLGHDVVGCDVSEDGVKVAQKEYANVRFEVGSVYDSDLADRLGVEFDMVISFEVIEHLFYPRRLPEQAHRLLRTGGFLVVSTPYHGYLKNLAIGLLGRWDKHFTVAEDGGHIKFFSRKTLCDTLQRTGFVDIRFEGVGRAPLLWKSMVVSAQKCG